MIEFPVSFKFQNRDFGQSFTISTVKNLLGFNKYQIQIKPFVVFDRY